MIPSGHVPPLTRTDIVRFAGAAGDFNPVHHDEPYAQELGFPSVFAMGMLTAGMLAGYVTSWAPIADVRALSVRFLSPAWPGEALLLEGQEQNADPGCSAYSLTVRTEHSVKVSGSVQLGGDRVRHDPLARAGSNAEVLDELTGREVGSVEFPVERGKIVEFARAIQSSNPVHYDTAEAQRAGWADLVAPLTFSAASAHWAGGDASELMKPLGLDLSRTLHGEHHWTYERPLVAGDRLTGTRRVLGAYKKPARVGGEQTFVHVATDYFDGADRFVLGEVLVVIERPIDQRKGRLK